MALTFPSSPSNGQIYADTTTGNRYIYNATAGVWSFAANNVGMSVSSTPPSNVAPGAMWFNREIGRTFVYYDDGDSKQWIETVPAGAVDTNTIASYTNPIFASMNGAYTTANAAYEQANTFVGVYAVSNAAFAKANAALANTSGTFAGDLSVTGNVNIGTTGSGYKLEVANGMVGITGTIPVLSTNYTNQTGGISSGDAYTAQYISSNATASITNYAAYGQFSQPNLNSNGFTSSIYGAYNYPVVKTTTGTDRVFVYGSLNNGLRNSNTDISTGTNSALYGTVSYAGHYNFSDLSKTYTSSTAYGSLSACFNINGTITNMYGGAFSGLIATVINSTGSATNYYGVYTTSNVGAASGTGTGTLTNYYDAYLAGVTVRATGTVTNKYGVYQAATGHTNYFAGSVGIGTASPTTNLHIYGSSKSGFKMTGGSTDSDINQRHLCQIDNVYTWTTLLSITPSTVGATWMRGFVKCSISCHNSGNGNGALIDAIWYLDLNGGSGATTAQVSAGTSSGSWPGQFRVNMSGNIWQLQVQSTNTANRFDGVAMFDILLSHGAGTIATYTIA